MIQKQRENQRNTNIDTDSHACPYVHKHSPTFCDPDSLGSPLALVHPADWL